MKRIFTLLWIVAFQLSSLPKLFSQVSLYSFNSSVETFSSIVNDTGTHVITTTADDDNYGTFPIGFSFLFNGNAYTTFGLNANGFISMGYVPLTTNNALSSGLNNNIIAAFNSDLWGVDPNAAISYQTTGGVGNRVCIVEWTNWGFYNNNGASEFSFQIKLFETTNHIKVVYGNCSGNTTTTLQVGLRGQSSADYNNRKTTTDWSATAAGTTNTATCTYNSSVKPTSGLTFDWTPVAAPRTLGTISSVQQTGTAAPGSFNNTILRIDIPVSGSIGELTLSSITIISKNTTDNDVALNGVKVWTGTSSAVSTEIGNGASFSGGSATISSINANLITGTNYIWLTYDTKITVAIGDLLDAKINVGGIAIDSSGGANDAGVQPSTTLNPSGAKTVDYCIPFSTYGGCTGDQIAGFVFAGIDYDAGNCIESPGYLDVDSVGTSFQGQSYNFTLSCTDVGDYASIWIDFNDNASFDDTGELVYSGGPGVNQIGSILIPLTAPVGTHRLRVRNNFDTIPPSSCDAITFGETKDFRISVNAATDCSGTPASSSTLSSVNPVCNDVPFTLSLSVQYVNLGITYQWQSSATGNIYTDISGATNSTFTTAETDTAYYHCIVTCSLSGESTISSALKVNVNPFTECYCIPDASNCSDDHITLVQFGGINNSSTCSPNGYSDYTSLTGITNEGTIENISVGVSSGGTEFVSVWIDYDHNAVFDESERTFIGSGFNQTISNTIDIPASALPGITTMRVRLEFAYEPIDPCITVDFGETEDYSVQINPCNATIFYADADADSYGDLNTSIVSCTDAPVGYVSDSSDCDDGNSSIHPGALEICNGLDDNCINGIDEGFALTTYYQDADNDGYGNSSATILTCLPQPLGYVSDSTDCDDTNANVNPGALEISNNGIDDNCNGDTDEFGVGMEAVSFSHFSFSLLPNPATDQVTVQLHFDSHLIKVESDAQFTIIISNIFGKPVFEKTARCTNGLLQQEIILDEKFIEGMYFVNISSDKVQWSKALLVLHR